MEKKEKTCALVFSGGALRGFSQVGAYLAISEFLKLNGYSVKKVFGTSFGSILAGFIASGISSEDILKISELQWSRLLNILDVKLHGGGFIKGDKFQKVLENHIGKIKLSEAKVDFILNACDIISGKEILFSRTGINSTDGLIKNDSDVLLASAIRASCSVPVMFSPVIVDDLVLLDGGLVTPLVLHTVDFENYDLVIGVDVCMANFDFISSKKINKGNIVKQCVSIIQRQYHFNNIDRKKSMHSNFVLIKPNIGEVDPKKKNEYKRAIDCGYLEAKKHLDSLKL